MATLASVWHQEELRRARVRQVMANHDRDIANLSCRFATQVGKKLEEDLGKSMAYSSGLTNLLEITKKDLEISSTSLAQMDAHNQSLSKALANGNGGRRHSGQVEANAGQTQQPGSRLLIEENQRLRTDLEKISLSLVDMSSLQEKYNSLQQELSREQEDKRKLASIMVPQNDMDDALRMVADLKAQLTVSESRLDAFRTKLRLTKAELRQATADLKSLRENKLHQTTGLQDDAAIHTTSRDMTRSMGLVSTSFINMKAEELKSQNTDSHGLGEKSFFSTTPFLSRIGPAVGSTANALGRFRVQESGRQKLQQPHGTKALGEEKENQEGLHTLRNPLTALGGKAIPKLSQPEDADNMRKDATISDLKGDTWLPEKTFAVKRKLLAGTGTGQKLFADEDVGQPVGKRLQAKSQGGGIAVRKPPVNLKSGSSGLLSVSQGQFSPLKRNRKVGANR